MLRAQLLDRLLAVTSLLAADQERELERIGLTPARTHVLWTLHHSGPSTQVTIAEALGVTPRNVTALVDALETAGFVHRTAHPGDRRAVIVVLSERGMATMETMSRDHAALDAALTTGLGDKILAATLYGLDHAIERLTALIAEHARSLEEAEE